MSDPNSHQFNVKVPKVLIDQIDADIETYHEYRSRSDWALAAMREFIKIRTKEINERKEAFGIEPQTPKGGGALSSESNSPPPQGAVMMTVTTEEDHPRDRRGRFIKRD